MEIYYINTREFLQNHDTAFLRKFSNGKEFKSLKRFTQFTIGRFLVKSVAKNVYNISDTEIIIENSKPKFKHNKIFFSISHSGDFVAAAFNMSECGLDIEEMKPRDFEAFSARYNQDFQTAGDFYKFWTRYEAEIKLQHKPDSVYSCLFQENFMLTAVADSEIKNVTITRYI